MSADADWDLPPPSPLRNLLWQLRTAVDDYEAAKSAHEAGAVQFLAVRLRGCAAAQHAEQIARTIRRGIRTEDGK